MTPRAREHRFRRLKELGCIACWMQGLMNVYPEIHHQNMGGKAGQKRRGDEYTIPLCAWHHRGETAGDHVTNSDMRQMLGPSLARESKAFRERFGSDEQLLAKTNELIRRLDEIAGGCHDGDQTLRNVAQESVWDDLAHGSIPRRAEVRDVPTSNTPFQK